MSSPSPALRSMSSTPARKDDISRSLRVRQRIPSPFVYTSAVSPNVRENCHGGETIIHRVDKVKNAPALIRPISLAALQKVTGLQPFEPGEFSSSRGIFSRRNSFSARQWSGEHDIKVSEKDNVEDIKFSNRAKENIGVRGSQALIKPAHMVAHTIKDYPNLPGKSPISCGDNPFAYSPGSKKSGIYNQGASWNPKPELSRKGSCGSEANPYHVTLTRNMGSHYLQQQLKLLSRPKTLPNFDAKFIGQTQTSAAFYGPSKVDHETYRNLSAKDVPLFDPLTIGLQKPNVVMRKCKEPRKFHKLSSRRESTIFEPKLHFAEVHQINLQDKRSKNNSDNTMGGKYQLVDALVTSSPETFEKFLYTVQPKRTRVHSSLDNQKNYAISVKNPTAQTVVLLRNQTNAYLRSAVSSRLLNYELSGENTDPITPRKLMVVPSLASPDDLNRTITIRTQTVRSSMTVSVQDQKLRPTENETVGSMQPRFNSIKPDAISSPHVYVCRPAKQTEMDSGNGTDEDEALTRNSGDSVKKAILYGSDENAGQYEDEVNEMEDDADGSDEASDSSGVIESDENPHGDEDPLPEDEASSTNEDTVTTISSSLTKSTAAQIVDGQLDAFLTGSETMPFDRKKLELVLQKQLAEQNASATVNTGNDTQTDVDQTSRGVQFYRTPPFANQTNRICPFTSRSTSRTPLVSTHGSSGLEGAETNEGYIQTSRECGQTTSNSHAMTDPSNSRTDPVTNRELPTQTTESDKGLIVSLEFKAGSNRMDDTLLSQSETGLCVDLANRQSPGTMCTKETMRRTTRKYFVPRQGSGESTPHPALISSLFPKVPPVLRFVDEGCKLESLPWEFRRLLRWRASMLTPAVVRQALLRSGFRVSKLTSATEDLETIESSDWLFYFGKHMRPQVFRSIREYQKVNHLPCSFQLGRKDRLWKNLVHMQMRCGKDSFNFMPQTFCLPTDLDALKKVWDEEGAAQRWILKPPASARGIGVRLITKWAQVPKKRPAIVQRYLARPFLINESKFDLRIYVYISSINPLRVYIHEDGLVRFASQKYTNSSRCLGNRFIHLTNYSINRLNSEYVSNTNDQATKGHKWSLRALWAYLRSQGISPAPVWSSIKDVVVKTAISTEAAFNAAVNSYCNHACSVHEVFGFDIFLDEDLQPWLLEVNVSPSMHSDSPLDAKIKGNMVRDMLNISGLHLPEPSDTNSHTVIPSCVVKSPVIRHQSSEFTDSVLRNPSPAVHFYSNGTMITPIIGTADADSSLGVTEQRLKNAGDMESSSPTIGRPTKKVRIPSHEWVIDSRLHLTQLSSDEREKRRYYIKRAIQYDFPKCSLYTPATGYRTSPATPNSIGSSPGMGNNNYQYSPESVSSKSSSIRSVGSTRIVGFQTSASSMGTVNNLPNCTVQSNISTPTPKSSATHGGHDDGDFIVAVADDDSDSNDNTGDDGDDDDGDDDDDDDADDDDDDDDDDYDNDDDGDDDDDDDDDEDLCTRNAKYSEVQLSDNTNNMCKKTARSMGIGPSSPDLRSHRVQNPNIFPGQNKETSNKPPTAPLSVRARIGSKQSNEMRTGSNTPTCRSTHRSGYCSGTESPVKPHTLPRVRLASATADILECLTPSDLRILIGMVDELERAGGFECIFPPPSAGLAVRYLSYFEAPRYSNLLCIAYLQKYADDKEKGIEMLRKHCAKNVHLISSAQGDEVPRENQWHRYVRNKKLPGKERSPTVATTSPGQTGKSSHHRISQLAQS